MRFIEFNENNPEHCEILKKNNRFPLETSLPFYFLVNQQDDKIVAECTITNVRDCLTFRIKSIIICDVYVEPEFRGNNYSVLLILNVLYTLAPDLKKSKIPVFIHAWKENTAAIRAYQKIFGPPCQISQRLVTFNNKRFLD